MNLAEKLYDDFDQVASHALKTVKPHLLSVCSSVEDIKGGGKNDYIVVKTIPFWRFFDNGDVIESKKPVAVKIIKGEELYFAENDNLCIFASGTTRDEALEDFEKQTVHFYFYYKTLSYDKVTGKSYELKKIYENNFSKAKV